MPNEGDAPGPGSGGAATVNGPAEQVLRTLVDRVTDAFLSVDRDWRFTYLNPSAERLLRRSAGSLVGKVLWDEYPDLDATPFGEAYREAAATGRTVSTTARYAPLDTVVEFTAYPDEHGISVVFRDRTGEQRLAAERARLGDVVERTADLVAMATPGGEVTYLNRAARRLLGVDAGTLPPGLDFASLRPAAARERLLGVALPIAMREGLWIGESAMTAADGSEVPVSEVLVAHRDGDGAVTHVSSILRDLRAQRAAAAALAEQQRRQELVLSRYPAGKIVLVDPSLRILLAEGRGLEAGGHAREAVLGRPLAEVCPPGTEAAITAGVRTAFTGEERTFEVDAGDRVLRFHTSPLEEGDGRVAAVLVISVDITAERRAGTQLRLLETAVAHLRDMVLITEAEPLEEPGPRIVFVNDAFVRHTGFTREQVLGRSPRMLQGPLTDPAATRAMAAALREAREVAVEVVNYTADGTPYWLDLQIAPILGEDGRPTHYVSVQRDITDRKRAEEEQRRTAERLAYALEGAQDGLWDWQVATGEVYFSPSWCRMLGYEPTEIAPDISSWTSLAHPDDLPVAMAALDAHFAGRVPQYECEHRMKRKDGTWAWILDRGKVVDRGADGAPLRMVGTHTDITDRKRTEAVLRAMAEATDDAQGSDAFLGDLVARLAQALDVRMAWVAELDGDRFRTLAVWGDGAAQPSVEYPVAGSACAATIASAREFHVPFGATEAFPTARWPAGPRTESYVGVPLRDGPGAVRGVLCVLDAEALPASPALSSLMHTFAARAAGELGRRQREAELRRRTTELARSQRIARLGSWRWNPSTNEIVWSDEQFRLYGVSPERFRPTFDSWLSLVHPEDRAAARATLASTMAARRPQLQNEFRIQRPDGTVAWIATIGEVEYGPDGQPLAADGTDQDVSDRKSLEAQLRQSQKMEAVGLLAGGVAHDFNNLLTVIRGNADFLLGALPDASQSWADAEEIRAAADRAAALTRQLLAFSRRQVLQPRVLEVDDVVAGVEKLLRRVIGEDIRLTVRMGARPAPVLIDPGQLEQVLLNLAVNARDAMQGGGTLEIVTARVPAASLPRRIAAPRGAVVLSVRDTGHGMDEATQARAFEPFFTTKEAGRGTGLGLATVFGIVEQSGGAVWLESTVGIGTSVMVALPVTDSDTAARGRSPDVVGPRGDGLVMVVEDDDAVRSLARRTLVRAGYGVIEARSGREALRLWDAQGEQVPQALVTDVVMPDLGGVALAQALRERHPGLPILFLSGYAGGHGTPSDIGAPSAFVEKPFATDALLAGVASLLRPAPR